MNSKRGFWILPIGLLGLVSGYLFVLRGSVPTFALGVVIACSLAVALLVPEIALHLFIFFSSISIPLIPGVASAAKLAGLVCTAAFGAYLTTRRRPLWFGGRTIWFLLILLGVICLSTIKGDWTRSTLLAIITFMFSIVAFVLFINIVDSPDRFRRVLNTIILAVMCNAAYGSYEFFYLGHDRAEGLIGQANGLGWYCVFALPFCYGFITETRGFMRFGYYLAAGIIILGLISSVSRAAFLGFLLSLVMFSLKGKSRGLVFMMLPLLVYGILITPYIPSRYWERMQSIIEGEGSARGPLDNPRVYFLKAGMKMWSENPVLGVGINNFSYRYAFEFNPGLDRGEERVSHSLYVQTLAETGSLGILALLGLLGSSFVLLRKTEQHVRRFSSAAVRKYLAGLEVGFLLFLFISNFSGGLLHYWNYVIIAMIVASWKVFSRIPAPAAAVVREIERERFPRNGRIGSGRNPD